MSKILQIPLFRRVILALALTTLGVQAEVLRHWSFDEGGGTQAYDSVTGQSMVLWGTPSLPTNPGWGFASPLDGTYARLNRGLSDGVATTELLSFDHDDPFSVSFWIRMDDQGTTGTRTILGRMEKGGRTRGWAVVTNVNDTDGIGLQLVQSSATAPPQLIQVFVSHTVQDMTWHHVGMSYDGTGSAAGVQIFIDGIAQAATPALTTDALPAGASIEALDSVMFTIGGREQSGTGGFDGDIDELAIFDNAVSASAIAALHNRTLDSDSDSIPDWFEQMRFQNLTSLSGTSDQDSDGRTDSEEFADGTNPSEADTDGDGRDDSQEHTDGTNPRNQDSDGDGLTDGEEATHGTNPLESDTDGDGANDGYEVSETGLSPVNFDIGATLSSTQHGSWWHWNCNPLATTGTWGGPRIPWPQGGGVVVKHNLTMVIPPYDHDCNGATPSRLAYNEGSIWFHTLDILGGSVGNAVPPLEINVDGRSDWRDGSIAGGLFWNRGNLTIKRSAVTVDAPFTNNATLLNSNSIVLEGNLKIDGQLTNGYFMPGDPLSFARIDLQDEADISGVGTLENFGILRKTVGTGMRSEITTTFFRNQLGHLANRSGEFEVDAGTLALMSTENFHDGGLYHVAAGAELELGGPSHFLRETGLPETHYTSTGSGKVVLTSARVHARGKTEALAMAHPVIFDFPDGAFEFRRGAFAEGVLVNKGFMDWANEEVNLFNGLWDDFELRNENTVRHLGPERFNMRGGTLINEAHGLFDILTDANVTQSPAGALINRGDLRKSAGSGTTEIQVPYTSEGGRVDVLTGELAFSHQKNYHDGGNYNVAPGATLKFGLNSSFDHFLRDTGLPPTRYTGSGGGKVIQSARWRAKGETETPSTTVPGVVLDFPDGMLEWRDGAFGGPGIFQNEGFIDVANTLAGANTVWMTGAELRNVGTIRHLGPARFHVRQGLMTNEPGGLFDIRTDATVDVSGGGTIVNRGLMRKSAGAGETLVSGLTNDGIFQVQSGSVRFILLTNLISGTLNGGTWIAQDAEFGFPTFAIHTLAANTEFVLDGTSADVPVLALLQLNAGRLTLKGGKVHTITATSFTNQSTGVVDVHLAFPGDDSSKLIVSNAATLGGELAVDFSNATNPPDGARWRVIDAASISGTFASTSFTNLPAGTNATVEYLSDGVEVVLNAVDDPVTYSNWVSEQGFATAEDGLPNADPDGDGIANLLVYATGGSRTEPPITITQEAFVSRGGVGGSDVLILEYRRPAGPNKPIDLVYSTTASMDLENWIPVEDEVVSPMDAEGMETVRATCHLPSGSTRGFLTWSVESIAP